MRSNNFNLQVHSNAYTPTDLYAVKKKKEAISAKLNWSGRQTNHLPPSEMQDKKWSSVFTPHKSSWRDN
jgi:hypothetical protein